MEIGYTPEHEALRAELREYYDNLLSTEVQDELLAAGTASGPPTAASGSRCAPTAGSASAGPRSGAARA